MIILLFRWLRLDRPVKVLLYTLAFTAFTITVTVASLTIGMLFIAPDLPGYVLGGVIGIGTAISGFITLPISFIILSTLHLQLKTLSEVRATVRYDSLTGALNRSAFMRYAIGNWRGGGAFLMVDADHFKQINDTYGHAAGDEALKRIADTLVEQVGETGEVGRLGGEEFAIFLPGFTLEQGETLAETVLEAMRLQDLPALRGERRITVSIGVVGCEGNVRIEDVMNLADVLLYQAKHKGRDCAVSPRTVTRPEILRDLPAFRAA